MGNDTIGYSIFLVLIGLIIILSLVIVPEGAEFLKPDIYYRETTEPKSTSDINTRPVSDIFITITTDKKNITVKLPRTAYFFNDSNQKTTTQLYNYLVELSKVLKELGEDKYIDNEELKLLAYTIFDQAIILYNLDKYKNNDYFTHMNPENSRFSQEIFYYLDSFNKTLSQLQNHNKQVENFFNKITSIQQTNYASNMHQALQKINTNISLPPDAKSIATLIVNEVDRITDNYNAKISSQAFKETRPILRKLINQANIDPSSRVSLQNALQANLIQTSQAKIFVDTLLTLLKADKTILNSLSNQEKTLIIKAVSSLNFSTASPLNTIISNNLAFIYNCQKDGGKIISNQCVKVTDSQ
jgi:hypothetical protein